VQHLTAMVAALEAAALLLGAIADRLRRTGIPTELILAGTLGAAANPAQRTPDPNGGETPRRRLPARVLDMLCPCRQCWSVLRGHEDRRRVEAEHPGHGVRYARFAGGGVAR
jgi:hypothetical protein